MAPLTVEIWSDIVCPWCYVGKRRFEAALAAVRAPRRRRAHLAQLRARPGAPRVREHTAAEHLAGKYGMSVEQAEAASRR